MNYGVYFQNGTTAQVTDACKNWCLEQHFTFAHNEAVSSLWILAVALFILIIYCSFRNCEQDTYDEFCQKLSITRLHMEKMLSSLIPLSMLLITMFIIYFLWTMPKGG